MKTLLFSLYILLCQWVVTLGDKYGNVGIENIICNADSEVFLALSGDKLPFAIETVWSSIDYTDITHMSLARFDKTNIQVRTSLLNDTHFTVKALCDGIRNVDPIYSVAGEPIKPKVNLGPWPGLGEAGHRHHSENKYEKHLFHAANIAKI